VLGLPPTGTAPGQPRVVSIGGILPVGNVAAALAMDAPPSQSVEEKQGMPVIQNLAQHIKHAFTDAKTARLPIEQQMIEALLARRGEYTSEKLQKISENRQPAIYMMVASGKMRQVESLLRDVMIGTGAEKPWTLGPTPVPDMPPEIAEQLVMQLTMEIEQAMMSGFPPTMQAAQMRMREMRTELENRVEELAREYAERMEKKMEDQLVEGGYLVALDQFISDLATFKTAFLAGPVVRNKPKLTWGQGGQMTVENTLTLEWERVDPFDMFPARYAKDINDGPLIRRQRLSREALNEMIGVDGFDEDAIKKVLELFGDSGLREWLAIDAQKAKAEGKTNTPVMNESGMIDALQYWGSASGKMLLEWGMTPEEIPDPSKEYKIEAWCIGNYVIKAVLNADPLARRPFYCSSFQKVPGTVWGNSPYDLMHDCQDMCNAAARALAANLGIASGPQVAVLSNRLPPGEDITEMYPWKIWQFESDPMGGTAAPITFFNPESHAQELMSVYEKFSALADEYTGIPKYMSGFNGGEGGAGRTASGISMMISNASKIIKQVVGAIDFDVITPMLERLYYYNMRYGDDPELKGDINVIARGASSLATKEAAQVRMNEFLQVALQSPVVMQILGIEGVAELLRPTIKRLDVNPDKVVPSAPILRQRQAEALQQQLMMMQAGGEPGADGEQQGSPKKPGGGEKLQNGAPTTDHFQPANK